MPKIDGLECWAYLSRNEFKYFYAAKGGDQLLIPSTLFPEGMEPDSWARVVIPRAVVLEDKP